MGKSSSAFFYNVKKEGQKKRSELLCFLIKR